MGEVKKRTSASTEVGKSNVNSFPNASHKRCNQQQFRKKEQFDKGEIHLHATFESALLESQSRIRNL